MAADPELSIIIPALNEEAGIAELIAQLQHQSLRVQIIVADGGSQDTTADLAESAGAIVVGTERGRAAQMNRGAEVARAGTLLFLHADSRLEAKDHLREALDRFHGARAKRKRIAGHFGLRFIDRPTGHDRLFRYMEAKTRCGRRGTINGDQGLMIHRTYFDWLGGFDASLPFLEDQRIAARIFDTGHWMLLPGTLQTSARRFAAEGALQRYALMALIISLHDTGLEDMLHKLPRLYVEQGRTRTLRMEPIARHVRSRVLREFLHNPRYALRVGQFVRQNLWQLAFMIDVGTGSEGEGPWTRRFEQQWLPRLDHPVADLMAAVGGAGGLLVVWPLIEQFLADDR